MSAKTRTPAEERARWDAVCAEHCATVSLWTDLTLAVRRFFGAWSICFNLYAPWDRALKPEEGRDYAKVRWWVWPVNALMIGPLFALEHGLTQLCMRWEWVLPPIEWLSRAHCWLDDRVSEPGVTHYVWLPADSGHPNEIGIHVRASQVVYGERDPETFGRPVLQRPRCYRYVSQPLEAADSLTIDSVTMTASSGPVYVWTDLFPAASNAARRGGR